MKKIHVWKMYLKNLFHDVRTLKESKIGEQIGPHMLLDEV